MVARAEPGPFPDIHDLLRNGCQSQRSDYESARDEYESAKGNLESELDSVDSAIGSAQRGHEVIIPHTRPRILSPDVLSRIDEQ